MNDNENLKNLYNTLQKEGYTPPAFEQFAKDMEDDNNLRGVYSTLQNEGYTPPDYDTFKRDMGFGNDKSVDLTAAKEGSEIGANAITNIMDGRKEPQPGKPKAQAGSHAQKVVDEYDMAAEQPMSDTQKAQMLGWARNFGHDIKANARQSLNRVTYAAEKAKKPLDTKTVRLGENRNVVTKTGFDDTGKPLKTYITETGNEYENRAGADLEQNLIDKERARRLDPINTELREAYDERERLNAKMAELGERLDKENDSVMRQMAEAGNVTGGLYYNADLLAARDNDQEYLMLHAAANKNDERIRSLEALRDKETMGTFGTIGRALKNTLLTEEAWDGGANDMVNARAMAYSGNVKGDAEKEASQSFIANYLLANMAADKEEREMGDLYRWAKIGGTSAAWAKDFFIANNAMRGLTKGGAKLGLKAAERLALSGWKKAAMKNLGIAAGDVAGATALASTLQGQSTAEDVTRRFMGDVDIDRNGELYFKGGDDIGTAVRKGVSNAVVENYTERIGEHIPSLSPLIKKSLGKLGLSTVNQWISKVGASDAYKTMTKWLQRSGFNGFGNEIIEEELNIALNAIFVGDQKFSDYLDPKTQADIIGGMALSMAFMSGGTLTAYGINRGINAAEYEYIKKKLNNADNLASQRLTPEKWEKLKEEIDGTPNNKIPDFIVRIAEDGNMAVQEKEAVGQYVVSLLRMRGHNLKETAQAEEQTVLDNNLTPEEQQNVHDDGMIHTALLYPTAENGGEPQEVFITKGNVVMRGDGTVDTEASSDAIYYKGSDGQVHMTSPDKIQSVNEPISVEEYAAAGEVNEPNMPNEPNTTEGFAVGDEVNVNIDDEQAAGEITGTTEDGLLIVSYETPDGTISSIRISPDELRNMNKPNDEQPPMGGAGILEEPTGLDNNVENFQQNGEDVAEDDGILPSYWHVGDEITVYTDGNPRTGYFQGQSEDGKIHMWFPGEGYGFREAFEPSMLRYMRHKYDSPAGTTYPETGNNSAENILQNGNIEPQNIPVSAETLQAGNGGPSALERIPKDEQGQPLYEQADPDTAWDAIMEQTGGDENMAQNVADSMVADKEAELKKTEKAKPKTGTTIAEKIAAERERKTAIEQAQNTLSVWQKIAQTSQRRKQAVLAEQAKAAEEAARLRREQEEKERVEREEAERKRREALNGVPDFVEDTPQNARARGYRRVNGDKVDRQQPIQTKRGNEVQVKFDDNNIPTGHAALIDAAQLQPSHINGQRNPLHFIDEAQPKERNDEASVMSARKIAANIRPEEITSSVTAYTGAPTVNNRGEVIQGNNRSAALREMWASHPEEAAKYKQYLTDHAADFGLTPEDVEAIQQPVLVNMLDVTDNDAITLGQFVAQDTESGGTERIKPKNIVQKMGGDMRSFANQLLASPDEEISFAELVDRNGLGVLKWMQQKGYITPTQYKSAFDSKGGLAAEAKNDLKGVMYQSIFQGGSTHLEEMFNALPAKAQKAILATAYRDFDSPNAERMNEEIQDSISAYYALSQLPEFANAKNYKEARQAAETWKRQYAMDDVTGESYLPSEKYSNFALLLATMYKGQSQTFIQNTFKHIYDLVQGTQEATLFEEPDNTPRTLVEAVNETLGNLREELLLNENFIYNGQRRSNVLAGDSATGQQGRQGGDGSATSGGRIESGAETPDSTERLANDGGSSRSERNGGENQERTEEEKPTKERLNKEEAADIIADMEEHAEVAPEVELTIENWDALFGEDGRVNTPIGEVKMGENQFAKLMRKGRNGKLGMIKPTLEDPDIIVEDKREAKDGANTERDSSYVFVKAFVKNDGSRYYYFTSITVSQDGKEVVVSNQEKSRNRVLRLMLEGSVIWRTPKDAATSSAEKQGLDYAHPNEAEDATKGSGITPQSTSSVRKDTDKSVVTQTIGEKVAKAEEETDTNPTEAQKEAGNYKKDHVRIGQFDITVENPKGSVRRGVDVSGKQWEHTMQNTYGYIRGTEGVDGDHIDVFLTNDIDGWNGRRVYIVDQYNEDGTFDEHKVMLGFNDEAEAQDAYLSNYEKGWEFKHKLVMSSANLPDFEKWINSSHRKTKPFAEYKSVGEKVSIEYLDGTTVTGEMTRLQDGDITVKSKENGRLYTVPERNIINVIEGNSVRFRKADDEISDFAQKHNLNRADVEAYADYMGRENLNGAARAFHEIRRKVRLDNQGASLGQFTKIFSPIEKELYDKFGNIDDLRQQYVQKTLDERNAMEAARKRAEEAAEAERRRLQEFQDMSDEQLDSEYIKAVEENDEGRMRDLVNEAARRKGYDDIQSDYQGVGAWAAPSNPGYESDEERREALQADGTDVNVTDIAEGYSSQPDDYFTNLRAYGNDTPHGKESAKAINDALEEIRKGNNPKIKVYRAVPKSVNEGRMRNGDWVTPSRKYAEMHGDNRLEGDYRIIEQEVPANELWWDGNDLNEWGFDDGKGYAYRNTKNNRKLNDLITKDDGGNVIPLSQRFNARKSDVRYNKDRKRSLSAEEAAIRDAVVDRLRESGLEVITDVEEGQRVLDEANGRGERVRTQAALNGLKKASDFILSALSEKTKQRRARIEIPERANRLAEEAIGHPIKSHAININELTHIKKRHGENGTANDANSIPLRDKDIALMPYIMAAPTRVVKGNMAANGTESVRYEKDLENGVVVVVEREGRFDVEDMENITMWANKKPATNVTVATKTSHSTSETIVISEADAAKIRKDAETAIENDGKIREQTRFFRTADGEAYGFTVGGKIYIDPRVATADTPIHEYAHLWASALRQGNQEEWQNVVGLMKGTPVWDEVKRKYPELTTDDEIADEVLATYSGRRGAERLKEEARKATSGKPVTEAARAVTAIGRVREALRKFWQNVADFLHIHYTSAEEVADRVMRDLLEGVNPAEVTINNEELNGDVRYSKAEDGNPENRSSNKHRELYEKRVNKRLGVFNRAWFDSMQPVKALQDAIVKETGQEIKPEENVYLNENRAASVAMRNHEVWERTHMDPVRKEIVRLMHQIMGGNKLTKHLHGGKTRKGAYNAVVKYMKSKHGLENNKYRRNEEAMNARTPFENEILEVEKAVKDGKMSRQDADKRQAELKEQADKAEQNSRAKTLKKDYSGLLGIYGEDFERKAKEYVADFESQFDTAPFWREWNGATKAILKEEYDAGLISKELYDKIRGMYEYYIPLKGWAENRAEDVYTYYTTGSGDGGKPHRREGRTSESDDPLVILEQDADRQFTAASRNRMKQTLYNLATGHKTSLLTVRRQWYVNNGTKENPDWERRDAEIPGNATPEEMEKIISNFEKDMRKKQKEGTAMRQKKPMILPYHATKRMEKEHTVRVMVNGKEYVIYVNGDPAAAQAVNGTSTPKDPDNEFVKKWILGPWRWWMRVKASLLTAINLNFIPSNLSRDALYSIQNMKAKEPAGYVARYAKNLVECMVKMTSARLFYKDKKGTLDMNDPTERLFKEFLDNGGETGYTVSHTLEQRRRRNMAAVNKLSGIDWFKGWRMLADSIEYVNRSVETIVRFSAYKTSREAGRSIPQSINDAKEASVNFDKHGSGELGNKEWRLAYIFANVQFQSTRRLLENASGHPVRFTLAQMERIATGFVVPMIAKWMLDAWGDDDEKDAYEELPEWMRQSGIALPLSPFGAPERTFLYLPLGPEDKIWYALGEMSYHVFNSDMPTKDMAKKFGLLTADLLPVDFQGYGGNMLVNLAPSVVQDAVALEQNVDYWGRPIYKEDMPYNEQEPGHNKAFIGTPEWFVKRSKEINALTGGDDYTRGAFSPKPEQIEYAVNQTGGGVSRVITQLMSLVERAGEDGNKDVPLLKNIPVLSSIVKQSEPQDGQEGYDREKYHGYMDEYEKTLHDYKAYKKGAKGGDAEAAEKAERLKDSPEGKRMKAINEKIKKIERKDRRVRKIDRKENPTQEEQEKREELKAESNELKQQLVEELDSISDTEKK